MVNNMAVFNDICENCISADVCRIKTILDKFSDDQKSPLGTDISIENCEHFIPTNDVEQ